MRRTELLQEIRKMRFEEAYAGWNAERLTQDEAARLLGMCERSYTWVKRRLQEGKLVPKVETTREAGGKVDKEHPTQFGRAMK